MREEVFQNDRESKTYNMNDMTCEDFEVLVNQTIKFLLDTSSSKLKCILNTHNDRSKTRGLCGIQK